MASEVKLTTYLRKKDNGWQYIIQYKDRNGKWAQVSKQGFKSKGEANEAMMKRYPEVEKLAKSNASNEKVTFKEYFEYYIDHIKLYREYNTIKKFNLAFKSFESIHKKELNKINHKDIQKIIDNLTISGHKYTSIQCYLKSIKVVFRSAKKDGTIFEMPNFENLEFKRNDIEEPMKVLTTSEIESLLSDFKDSKYYLFLWIASKTGMRVGEVLGLNWEDINFTNNKITINKQLKRRADNKFIIGTLKTKNSNRIIELPLSLKTILEPIRSNGKIFDIYNMDSYTKYLNFKLRPYGITIHGLRHSFATNLLGAGLDYKTVADILGHSVAICMQTYSHVNTDMKQRAANVINSIL